MARAQRTVQRSATLKSTKDSAIHKVENAKITKARSDKKDKRSSFWGLPLMTSLFGKKKTSDTDDLEGDTIVSEHGNTEPTNADDDFTLVDESNDDETPKDEDGNEDGSKDEIEEPEQTLQQYRNDSYMAYDDPRLADWTSEETWYFNKLRNRSREPLLNWTWFKDFEFLPDQLFTSDPTQILLTHNHCTIYRAIKALKDLCFAGPKVRAQLTSGAPPERPLNREISNFYKWTLADANIQHKAHIPTIAIACAKPRETTESLVSRLTDQLHDLGRQYRDKWRHPDSQESDVEQRFTHDMPTLFGFIIKYTVVATVTCDSRVPRKPIRTQHTADWKMIGQDAWHAIAVAIALVRQRNYLMQLDAEGELGPEIIDDGDDPDA